MPNLSGPTLFVILFVVLLLFGAPKLPALARSLGQSMKILKKEVSTPDEQPDSSTNESTTGTSTPDNTGVAANAAELAEARAEADALRAEAEALRAQAEDTARKSE